MYTQSEKSGCVLISEGVKFKYKTQIDQIIEDKRCILNDYTDKNGDQMGENILAKYKKYQDSIDSDSIIRSKIEMEIGELSLDMKSVISNDQKNMLFA